MKYVELLQTLKGKGILLTLSGDRLKVDALAGRLITELRGATLQQNVTNGNNVTTSQCYGAIAKRRFRFSQRGPQLALVGSISNCKWR